MPGDRLSQGGGKCEKLGHVPYSVGLFPETMQTRADVSRLEGWFYV
jgi:hypothetical protein